MQFVERILKDKSILIWYFEIYDLFLYTNYLEKNI